MDFVSNQQPQIKEMLKALGIKNVGELIKSVPKSILEPAPIEDDGMSEYEGYKYIERISEKNNFHRFDSYLGAGAYAHHTPAIVKSIISKSGFLTAYTPYQAEASQGLLQTIYEFQSALCRLTGHDLSNASLYDGASACAEALLMSMRLKPKRGKVLVAQNIHPHYFNVISQYLGSGEVEVVKVRMTREGLIDRQHFEKEIDENTCAALFGYPNFLGNVEDLSSLIEMTKEKGALSVLSANPLIFGLYKSAENLGADIVVGDTQPFGIPLQFGGPYAGYISCRKEYVRQLPGRLVGRTKDSEGNQGFVLTLQTREQHIRREKATSNICSNQALCALSSLVAMLWYGPEGIAKLALTNYQRAQYLRENLGKMTHIELLNTSPILNEFVIKVDRPVDRVLDHFRLFNIEAGVSLAPFYPELDQHLLIAVTELKSQSDLDHYLEVAAKLWQ